MQNPLSYHSIRSLFIPVDPMLLDAEQSSQSNILSFNSEERKTNKKSNVLSTIMPIKDIIQQINYSNELAEPLYITVTRQIGSLNTKDVLFGIFRSKYTDKDIVLFEDVDNDVMRIIKVDEIMAVRSVYTE
ncbi:MULTISPECIES: hypothetical protein [Aerococcus]|uniref:YolD-like protein n=1 Tax=Aerococcus viridans TaxID=1377 RepID=A0A2N6UFP6_9LACT|nr:MULTISPECIES: hypothetical protein [Aerococcus]OFU49948.1 hypothetical protein HMPREF3116_06050 [Aerococcus sp. HMSC10H05]PMC80372.1 hypothetical protein CJ191_02075 [Aerococcus viridans]